MDRAWPRATVGEGTIQVHISVVRKGASTAGWTM
jgi:DNA-binding winged helix-turn-helix (wHTH) protein